MMPRLRSSLVLLVLLCGPWLASAETDRALFVDFVPWTVCFTPGMDCTGLISGTIGQAKATVLVQAYSFTSAPIAKALAEAQARGVQVQVILDKSQRTEKYSVADFLVNHGVGVWIDTKHAIAHNKVMIIDGQTVLTGSFNLTKQAQCCNAENLLRVDESRLAQEYTQVWQAHQAHSQRYQGRGP